MVLAAPRHDRSTRCRRTLARALLLVAAALALSGCAQIAASRPASLPAGYRLVQKRDFQALYGADGRLVRLIQDADHDGRADAVVDYRPNGKPRSGEIDTDADGVVDRWESFRLDGSLERVAVSRLRNGRPDAWEEVRSDGSVAQRDWDDDGDGRPDRTDYP